MDASYSGIGWNYGLGVMCWNVCLVMWITHEAWNRMGNIDVNKDLI